MKYTSPSKIFDYTTNPGKGDRIFVKRRLSRLGLENILVPIAPQVKEQIANISSGTLSATVMFLVEFALDEMRRQRIDIDLILNSPETRTRKRRT